MNNLRTELIDVVKKVQPDAVLDAPECFKSRFRDIGIDSLEVMNVLLAVQEKFGVEIPDVDIDGIKTLADLEDYIVYRI